MTLSDKIKFDIDFKKGSRILYIEDVKEAIDNLLYEVDLEYNMGYSAKFRFKRLLIKVFGENLTK